MPVCAIVNHKGGVGKTTIATNLASAFQLSGKETALVDSDPQGSARDWRAAAIEAGNDNNVFVAGLDRPTLDKDVPKMAKQYDWTFIDGAARDTLLTTQAIAAADVVLIPVRPSPYDCWAIADLVGIVKQRQAIANGQPKAALVISAAIVGTKIDGEARKALLDYELPIFESCTHNRVIYAKAAADGRSVIEAEPKGPAAEEIKGIKSELERFYESE